MLTTRFLRGLHDLGKELFDKGIASVKLAPTEEVSKNLLSSFWGDELFIINLEGSYFIVMTDPQSTIKMMQQQVSNIPEEMDYQIRSVLVGQASIQYANIMSTVQKTEDMIYIDRLFQTPLDEVMSKEDQKENNVFVDNGSCSFSGLDSIQCLIFHYLLREHFATRYGLLIKNPWSMIQHKSGLPVYLEFQPPKETTIFASMLALLNNYSQSLLNCHLSSLVFGDSSEFTSIDIIHGKESFMSVSSPLFLFNNLAFLSEFNQIDKEIRKNLSKNLVKYLSKEISIDYLKNLEQKALNELIRLVGAPKF